MTTNLVVLLGVGVLHVLVFTGATWALLVAVGGRATEAAFGTPGVIKGRIAGTAVSLGPIPTGSVTILGRLAEEPAIDPRDWRRLALGKRIVVLLVPWLIVFGIAIACLGPDRAVTSLIRGFYQVVLVLDLTPLVRRLVALVETSPIHVIVGLVFAKSTALNLLPLPGLAGGGLVMELAGVRRPTWFVLGTVVMLFVSVRLIYALIRVVIG